jgi:hypothetical protein
MNRSSGSEHMHFSGVTARPQHSRVHYNPVRELAVHSHGSCHIYSVLMTSWSTNRLGLKRGVKKLCAVCVQLFATIYVRCAHANRVVMSAPATKTRIREQDLQKSQRNAAEQASKQAHAEEQILVLLNKSRNKTGTRTTGSMGGMESSKAPCKPLLQMFLGGLHLTPCG